MYNRLCTSLRLFNSGRIEQNTLQADVFTPVPPHPNLLQLEESILRYWRTHRTHEKVVAARLEGPAYIFSRRPASASHPYSLQEAFDLAQQDLFLRYKAMRGYNVSRQVAWQAHGVAVELEAERLSQLSTQPPLRGSALETFIDACRQVAARRLETWDGLAWRLGFWRQLAGAAATCDDEYIQSVWWGLKTFWEKGWLAPSVQVAPYCPRCATPLDALQLIHAREAVEALAAYVHLPLVDAPRTSLLVWCEAIWKLPGAVAVVVHPNEEFLVIERRLQEGGAHRVLLPANRLEAVFPGETFKVIERLKGRKLRSRRYRPLYTFLPLDKPAHYVVVSEVCGKGLTPVTPAFSQAHLQLAQELDLPVLPVLTEQNTFIPEVRPWSGKPARQAAPLIVADLQARGLLERSETQLGDLPLCPECATPVVFLPRSAWFVHLPEAHPARGEENQAATLFPPLEQAGGCRGNNARQRLIGLERYWGAPMPVWECQVCRHQVCVGSLAELSELAGEALSGMDLHRPQIDRVRLVCPHCREPMQRVPEVVAPWFEEGALPFAGWGFPWFARQSFEESFPADLISESEDQHCRWLGDLEQVAGALFDRPAYKHAVRLGGVTPVSRDETGLLGEAVTTCGSDALRFYAYLHSRPGRRMRVSLDGLRRTQRAWTTPLWGAYHYFVECANRLGWQPHPGATPDAGHVLDRWLLSETQVLVRDVTTALEIFDTRSAALAVDRFVDSLSRWYLRLSRRRLSSAGADLACLYGALMTLAHVLAPLAPLLAEELYSNLAPSGEREGCASVHAADWPLIDLDLLDPQLQEEMALLRALTRLGWRCRQIAGIRLRQPVGEVSFWLWPPEERAVVHRHADLLAQALNAQSVRLLDLEREVAGFELIPDLRAIGEQHAARTPAVLAALAELDVEGVARALLAGHTLHLAVGGKAVSLSPAEVAVSAQPFEGLVTARRGSRLAAMPVEQPASLAGRGLAQDFVRQVQNLRKQAGFEPGEPVRLYVQATPELRRALDGHKDFILSQLRLERWVEAQAPPEASRETVRLGKEFFEVGLQK